MNVIHRKGWVLFLFICVLVLFIQPVSAENSDITISTKVGIDGNTKSYRGYPVKITIENKGEAFSGALLVRFNSSYNSGGSKVIKVELDKASSKTYEISLPYSDYQVKQNLYLYRGDWKDDQQVSFKGSKQFTLSDSNNQLIGIMSKDYDRLKELKVLPSGSYSAIKLTKEEIPHEALGLEMFDYLILDEFAVNQLDEGQQMAIVNWIKEGGTLIAGATADANLTYGSLYELLPMKSTQETEIKTEFLNNEANPATFKTLSVFTGDVATNAKIMIEEGDVPAVISKEYASGKIIQTSFSLGAEPLASWNGYGKWFESVIIHPSSGLNVTLSNNGESFNDRLYYNLAETNEYFSSSNFSASLLSSLMIIYLILLIPVLYFSLKKIDKREHAWWIIPSAAIVVSIAIFGVGAKDRMLKPQLNTMGVYLKEEDVLSGINAVSLLSNTSGDYSLTYPLEEFWPLASQSESTASNPKYSPVFEEKTDKMSLTFPDVEFWSNRSAYGKALVNSTGSFEQDLIFSNHTLSGTVKNTFPYDFDDLMVWSGSSKISLGKVKSGETITVNEIIKNDILIGPNVYQSGSYNSQNGQLDIGQARSETLSTAVGEFFLEGRNSKNQPLFVGSTKQSVIQTKLTNKKTKQLTNNLILQYVPIKGNYTGTISLKESMLTSWITIIEGSYDQDESSANEAYFNSGEYEYFVQFPDQINFEKFKLEELSIKSRNTIVTYSLMNQKTGKFEDIFVDNAKFILTDNDIFQNYVSEAKQLRMKIKVTNQGYDLIKLPNITLKGEMTN